MIVLLALLVLVVANEAKLPDYIHVCKRSDPNINQCIIKSVNNLRPNLIEGIPELDVPPIEPLYLEEVNFSLGEAFKAIATDVLLFGCSNFEILDLESNINDLEFKVKIRFPLLFFNATYDVDTKLLMPMKGKGPLAVNSTEVEGDFIVKGHKITDKDNGRTFVRFDKLELKSKIKNVSVRLDNLFNGNDALGEAINIALNQNKREMMRMLKPRAEGLISEVILGIANKITTHFDYDELFA